MWVKATSNDPNQQVRVDGAVVKIRGKTTANGIVPSNVALVVDGQKISVPLTGGMTPRQTAKKIAEALPESYLIKWVDTKRGVGFEIVRGASLPPPPAPDTAKSATATAPALSSSYAKDSFTP